MDKQEAETARSCPRWARDKIPGLPASVVAVWVCTRRVLADFAAVRYKRGSFAFGKLTCVRHRREIHVSRCERIM